MEHGEPDAARDAVHRDEPDGQNTRARTFEKRGGPDDEVRQPDDAAHLRCGNGFLHHDALFQTDLLAGDGGARHGHGHYAETADLDHNEDDQLPEERPVRVGVEDDQPVTHVALVAVNRASANGVTTPLRDEIGSMRSPVPVIMRRKNPIRTI